MEDKYTLYKMLYNKVEKLSKYKDIYLCKYTEDNKEVTKIFIDDGIDYYDGYRIINYHTGKKLIAFLLMNDSTKEKIFVVHNKKNFNKVIEIKEITINLQESSKMVIDGLLVQYTLIYSDSRNEFKSMALIFNNNTGELKYIVTDIESISNNPNKKDGRLLMCFSILEYSDVYLTYKGIISSNNEDITVDFLPDTIINNSKLRENIVL